MDNQFYLPTNLKKNFLTTNKALLFLKMGRTLSYFLVLLGCMAVIMANAAPTDYDFTGFYDWNANTRTLNPGSLDAVIDAQTRPWTQEEKDTIFNIMLAVQDINGTKHDFWILLMFNLLPFQRVCKQSGPNGDRPWASNQALCYECNEAHPNDFPACVYQGRKRNDEQPLHVLKLEDEDHIPDSVLTQHRQKRWDNGPQHFLFVTCLDACKSRYLDQIRNITAFRLCNTFCRCKYIAPPQAQASPPCTDELPIVRKRSELSEVKFTN